MVFVLTIYLYPFKCWICLKQLIQTTAGAKWRTEHVEQAHFYTNKDIDKLLSETEATVTHELGGFIS
jgi:hypothetical protein